MLGKPTDGEELFLINELTNELEELAYIFCKNEGYAFPDCDCEPYFYDNAFCYN